MTKNASTQADDRTVLYVDGDENYDLTLKLINSGAEVDGIGIVKLTQSFLLLQLGNTHSSSPL